MPLKLTSTIMFNMLNIASLSLMFVVWLNHARTSGFLLLLFLALMSLVRMRFKHPNINKTIFVDLVVTLIIFLISDSYKIHGLYPLTKNTIKMK